MGASFYLTCKNCVDAADLLHKSDKDEIAETLEDDARFSLDDLGSEKILDWNEIMNWLAKHRAHGELMFEISI